MFYATEKDFRNSVEILIPLSASLNEELEDGRILLHVAAEKGNIQLVRKALEAGADINNKFLNPLQNAVKFYQYEMAKFLIKNGAIVDERLKKRTKDKQMLEILNMDVSFLKEFFNE